MLSMHQYQQGFSLLEILVAWVILVVVLLGVAKLEIKSFKQINQAYHKSVAIVQAKSMLARLQLDKKNAAKELKIWNQQNKHLLPQGFGSYHCSKMYCQSSLSWGGKIKHRVIIP